MVKVLYIDVVKNPEIIEIDGSLKSLQELVGGCIEAFDVLFGEKPLLWINDEGMFTQLPNRAVYATKEMEKCGYVSQFNGSVVKEEDLYTVLFGPIVAMSYDRDKETGEDVPRDITAEEAQIVLDELGDRNSGVAEILALQLAKEFDAV